MTQAQKHADSAFPELTRLQLECLCLRQNERVAELLAVLKDALAAFEHGTPDDCRESCEAARAAIAKAEGR